MSVVVSGIGVVSPVGITSEVFYDSLLNGLKNIHEEKQIYLNHGRGGMTSRISEQSIQLMKKQINNSTRYSLVELYAIHAIDEALRDANISIDELRDKRVVIILGNGDLEADTFDLLLEGNEVEHSISSYGIPEAINEYFGINANAFCVHTACASSLSAVDIALKCMNEDEYDLAIVGGVDSFSKTNYAGFSTMRALSKSSCAPFAECRDGVTIGEGAGILVLQNAENASNSYCEVVGAGTSSDAYHLVRCCEEGAIRAIKQMMEVYNVKSEDINLVICHGTGTVLNDIMEANIINQMYQKNVKVCSIKGTIGHLMGASGAVAAALGAMILKYGKVPPELHGKNIDPKCSINLVTDVEEENLNIIVCHAFGFGGNNSVIALKKSVF